MGDREYAYDIAQELAKHLARIRELEAELEAEKDKRWCSCGDAAVFCGVCASEVASTERELATSELEAERDRLKARVEGQRLSLIAMKASVETLAEENKMLQVEEEK